MSRNRSNNNHDEYQIQGICERIRASLLYATEVVTDDGSGMQLRGCGGDPGDNDDDSSSLGSSNVSAAAYPKIILKCGHATYSRAKRCWQVRHRSITPSIAAVSGGVLGAASVTAGGGGVSAAGRTSTGGVKRSVTSSTTGSSAASHAAAPAVWAASLIHLNDVEQRDGGTAAASGDGGCIPVPPVELVQSVLRVAEFRAMMRQAQQKAHSNVQHDVVGLPIGCRLRLENPRRPMVDLEPFFTKICVNCFPLEEVDYNQVGYDLLGHVRHISANFAGSENHITWRVAHQYDYETEMIGGGSSTLPLPDRALEAVEAFTRSCLRDRGTARSNSPGSKHNNNTPQVDIVPKRQRAATSSSTAAAAAYSTTTMGPPQQNDARSYDAFNEEGIDSLGAVGPSTMAVVGPNYYHNMGDDDNDNDDDRKQAATTIRPNESSTRSKTRRSSSSTGKNGSRAASVRKSTGLSAEGDSLLGVFTAERARALGIDHHNNNIFTNRNFRKASSQSSEEDREEEEEDVEEETAVVSPLIDAPQGNLPQLAAGGDEGAVGLHHPTHTNTTQGPPERHDPEPPDVTLTRQKLAPSESTVDETHPTTSSVDAPIDQEEEHSVVEQILSPGWSVLHTELDEEAFHLRDASSTTEYQAEHSHLPEVAYGQHHAEEDDGQGLLFRLNEGYDERDGTLGDDQAHHHHHHHGYHQPNGGGQAVEESGTQANTPPPNRRPGDATIDTPKTRNTDTPKTRNTSDRKRTAKNRNEAMTKVLDMEDATDFERLPNQERRLLTTIQGTAIDTGGVELETVREDTTTRQAKTSATVPNETGGSSTEPGTPPPRGRRRLRSDSRSEPSTSPRRRLRSDSRSETTPSRERYAAPDEMSDLGSSEPSTPPRRRLRSDSRTESPTVRRSSRKKQKVQPYTDQGSDSTRQSSALSTDVAETTPHQPEVQALPMEAAAAAAEEEENGTKTGDVVALVQGMADASTSISPVVEQQADKPSRQSTHPKKNATTGHTKHVEEPEEILDRPAAETLPPSTDWTAAETQLAPGDRTEAVHAEISGSTTSSSPRRKLRSGSQSGTPNVRHSRKDKDGQIKPDEMAGSTPPSTPQRRLRSGSVLESPTVRRSARKKDKVMWVDPDQSDPGSEQSRRYDRRGSPTQEDSASVSRHACSELGPVDSALDGHGQDLSLALAGENNTGSNEPGIEVGPALSTRGRSSRSSKRSSAAGKRSSKKRSVAESQTGEPSTSVPSSTTQKRSRRAALPRADAKQPPNTADDTPNATTIVARRRNVSQLDKAGPDLKENHLVVHGVENPNGWVPLSHVGHVSDYHGLQRLHDIFLPLKYNASVATMREAITQTLKGITFDDEEEIQMEEIDYKTVVEGYPQKLEHERSKHQQRLERLVQEANQGNRTIPNTAMDVGVLEKLISGPILFDSGPQVEPPGETLCEQGNSCKICCPEMGEKAGVDNVPLPLFRQIDMDEFFSALDEDPEKPGGRRSRTAQLASQKVNSARLLSGMRHTFAFIEDYNKGWPQRNDPVEPAIENNVVHDPSVETTLVGAEENSSRTSAKGLGQSGKLGSKLRNSRGSKLRASSSRGSKLRRSSRESKLPTSSYESDDGSDGGHFDLVRVTRSRGRVNDVEIDLHHDVPKFAKKATPKVIDFVKLDHTGAVSEYQDIQRKKDNYFALPANGSIDAIKEAIDRHLAGFEFDDGEDSDVEASADAKGFIRIARGYQRMADQEKIEKKQHEEERKLKLREFEYHIRNRRKSQEDIEYEQLLSRPIRMVSASQRNDGKNLECSLGGENCSMCGKVAETEEREILRNPPSRKIDMGDLPEPDKKSKNGPEENSNRRTRRSAGANSQRQASARLLQELRNRLDFIQRFNEGLINANGTRGES